MDQSVLAEWCGLSICCSGTAAACATECDSNRLSCSLRRVSHRDGSRVRNLRQDSQRFRPDLHAFVIVLFQLSGRSRSILAILWSLARSFCARPLLSLFHHWSKRRTFIAKATSGQIPLKLKGDVCYHAVPVVSQGEAASPGL